MRNSTTTNRSKQPTALDVFCGAGGLTLGLKQANFNVVGAIEVDPTAAQTYRLNHPEVELWEQDVRSVKADDILKNLKLQRGELDLLAGCPPCQGFSSMRTRKGKLDIDDPRNDLVVDFLRLIEGIQPRAVMMENVPDLAKDERMDFILRELQRLGYDVTEESVQIRNVRDFEVPQSRRRLILMVGRGGKIFFPAESKNKLCVRDVIGGLPKPEDSNDLYHKQVMRHGSKVSNLITHIPKDGGSRKDLPESMQLECHKKERVGFHDVYGRMSWDEVSPTITGGCTNPSKGRFLHPEQDRAISLREAALLQGFPEKYEFSLRRGRDFASLMIGNALPPSFVKIHALSIANFLKNYP